MFRTVSIFVILIVAETVYSLSNATIDYNQPMRGWQVNEYGGLEKFKFYDDIPIPKIKKPTEVLIEMVTTSFNQIDEIMIGGYGQRVLNLLRVLNGIQEFPITLGRDFVGIVKAKGRRVNGKIEIGDKVWGVIEPHQVGALAEYIVVDQKYVIRKPNTIDDIGAGGIMYSGLTAWSSFYHGGLFGKRNQKVCILGASGGVGTIALQIAKAESAIVTATCSKSAIRLVKELGADHIIDYTAPNADEQFRDIEFDIILDCAGLGPEYAIKVPWKYQKYITLLPPLLNDTDSSGIVAGSINSVLKLLTQNARSRYNKKGTILWGIFRADRKGIDYLTELTQNNKLKPVIDSVFEFKSADKALQKLHEGHLRGKVIVQTK